MCTYPVSVTIRSNRKVVSLSEISGVSGLSSRAEYSRPIFLSARSYSDYSKSGIQHGCRLTSRDKGNVACQASSLQISSNLYLANNLISLYRPLAVRSFIVDFHACRSDQIFLTEFFFCENRMDISNFLRLFSYNISFRESKMISHERRLEFYHRIFERQVLLLCWSGTVSCCVYVLGDRYREAATIGAGFIAMRMDT